jgi:hypothetical protein
MSNAVDPSSTNVPSNSRWLNATRGIASASLIIAAVTVAMHADAQDLVALVPTAPLWLSFLWMLVRLMGKTIASQKRGLALAVALGPYPLIFSSLVAASDNTNTWRAGFAIYAALHLLLLMSAVKTYYSMKPEPGDNRMLASRLIGGFFYLALVIAAILIPHMMVSRVAGDEASAVAAMRSINRAQAAYADKHANKGFASTLSELGQGSGADVIDQDLAVGRKMHYTFAMTAGPADLHGRITMYSIVARPERFGKDGVRSFFNDESRVIRYTAEDRPPTILDAPI